LLRRGWRLPTLTFTADGGSAGGEPAPWDPPPPQGPAVGGAGGRADQALELVDFWPYWLDGWDPATVHNSLTLEVGGGGGQPWAGGPARPRAVPLGAGAWYRVPLHAARASALQATLLRLLPLFSWLLSPAQLVLVPWFCLFHVFRVS
jgi:hypothetical protein